MDNTTVDRDALEEKLQDPTASSTIPLPFEFLKDITSNFSNEQLLGRGGYGAVYKGILRSGKIIAVKKLFEHVVEDDQFQKEVTNLVGIKHQNIVQLVGYCAESRSEAIAKLPSGTYVMPHLQRSLLCFEYLGNKSLDKHISDESWGLDWNNRYKIIKGLCSGLLYLHGECNIVHLDLKPENILMDEAMTPKIADFGLSKILGAQKSRTIISGNVSGTLGYMAPEYQFHGIVSPKADDRWRDVFRIEPKYTSPEICTQQVEQCITTALECLDYDPTRRPTACEISQMLMSEVCSCQRKTLLSAQPFELRFNFNYQHEVTSCPLQLTNNTDDVLAFSIVANIRDKHFVGPPHGFLLPRSTCTRRVAMFRPLKDENLFTIRLMCTRAGDHHQLLEVQESNSSADEYNHFFTEAEKNGGEVQQVKLRCVIAQDDNKIIVAEDRGLVDVSNIIVHPTKTWIIISTLYPEEVHVFDYQTQKRVPTSEFSTLDYFVSATFVSGKQWLVTGSYSGYLKVYDDRTMEEVKTFRAHNGTITSLDLHPNEPYLLSACFCSVGSTVKLWNWEKGWEWVRTFDITTLAIQFNPKDADCFAYTTRRRLEIRNITASPATTDKIFSIRASGGVPLCLDYVNRGAELHLITGQNNGTVKIWNWQSQSYHKTIQGHTEMVSSIWAHPDLATIITGSYDGTVCLLNSFTFELQDKLNYGLGRVNAIACLKGTNRIAIGHQRGLVITEI